MTGPKIMFVAPSAYVLGGVATWLDYLLPGLRGRQWNACLALVDGKFHVAEKYLCHHPEPNACRIPCGTGTQEGRIRELYKVIESERPEIIVSVNIADTVAAVNRLRMRSGCHLRVVSALHGIEPALVESIKIDSAMIDAAICTNQLSCKLVSECTSLDSERIHYAPCGVPVEVRKERPKRQLKKLRIGFVGRLDRGQKRIDDLLSISAELARREVCYELLVVGEGPDENWFITQLQTLKIRDRIQLLGRIDHRDLFSQIYDHIDVLLITSPRETGPLVAWEAMSRGVVVVTSAFIGSGLEGSFEDSKNCLMFPVGDAVAAAESIERLQNPYLYSDLSSAGRNLVARRYTVDGSIDMWSAALFEIVSRPARDAVPEDTRSPAAGRLDRLLGAATAETVRVVLGLTYTHSEPGGEWPHAKSRGEINNNCFLKLAARLDK